jgi:hypothetical protein
MNSHLNESFSKLAYDQMVFRSVITLLGRVSDLIHEFVAGAALSWAATPYVLKRRHETENMFMLATILAIWGNSPLPLNGRLFLLPYTIPQILYWRRRLRLWDDSLESADLKHLGH